VRQNNCSVPPSTKEAGQGKLLGGLRIRVAGRVIH
jgi:hypothetical protein